MKKSQQIYSSMSSTNTPEEKRLIGIKIAETWKSEVADVLSKTKFEGEDEKLDEIFKSCVWDYAEQMTNKLRQTVKDHDAKVERCRTSLQAKKDEVNNMIKDGKLTGIRGKRVLIIQ